MNAWKFWVESTTGEVMSRHETLQEAWDKMHRTAGSNGVGGVDTLSGDVMSLIVTGEKTDKYAHDAGIDRKSWDVSVGRVTLIGKLGANPVMSVSDSGQHICMFSVGVKADDLTMDWHQVSVVGRQADVCAKYLSRAVTVYVEGSLRNVMDGVGENGRVYSHIVADRIEFISVSDDAKKEGK